MNSIYLTLALVTAFVAGLLAGGIGTILCVRFGIRAAYEVRKGNQGLFKDKEDADAEFDILDEKEKEKK